MKKPTWGGVSRLWAWTVCGLSVCLAPLAAGADAPRAYALVLPETTSAEGDVAVASVKSPAHVKPEVPLVIVAESNPGEMPEGDGMVEQNVVIAVKSGVRLHTLHDLPEHVFPYFPGMNHAGLQALWVLSRKATALAFCATARNGGPPQWWQWILEMNRNRAASWI